MPALMACATDRNLGFSSDFRRVVAICRVKVEASHSRTSGGTASGCTSDSSSSSSAKRLHRGELQLKASHNTSWYEESAHVFPRLATVRIGLFSNQRLAPSYNSRIERHDRFLKDEGLKRLVVVCNILYLLFVVRGSSRRTVGPKYLLEEAISLLIEKVCSLLHDKCRLCKLSDNIWNNLSHTKDTVVYFTEILLIFWKYFYCSVV